LSGLRFQQIPEGSLGGGLDDEAVLMSTDLNLLNTADMNLVTTSDLNAVLPSEEILR
jgi:hypothetical protein